ncbi:unnamed protein product [Urochloa humidicola]
MAFDLNVTSLRDALREAADPPGPGRRITVSRVKISDSAPLHAVLRLHSRARGSAAVWNLGRVATVACVEACCYAIKTGFLRILDGSPTRAAALALLKDFARYIQTKADGTGKLLDNTVPLCKQIISHANAANHSTAAEEQRQRATPSWPIHEALRLYHVWLRLRRLHLRRLHFLLGRRRRRLLHLDRLRFLLGRRRRRLLHLDRLRFPQRL